MFGVVGVVANPTLPGSLIFPGPIALPPLHPVRISALDVVGREGDARAAALGGGDYKRLRNERAPALEKKHLYINITQQL